MKKAIKVRRFVDGDFYEVADMSHQVGLLHAKSEPEYIDPKYQERLDVKKDMADYLKKNKKDKPEIYVATMAGEIAGYVLFTERRTEPWWTFRRYLYIDELWVRKEFRRMDAATALIETVKMLAERKGIGIVRTRVWDFNDEMARLLKGLGGRRLFHEYAMKAERRKSQ